MITININDILNVLKGGEKVRIDTKKYNLLLANRSMSVKELASLSRVNEVTLCRIKNGTQVARPQTLGKIAKALNCKVEDFIED